MISLVVQKVFGQSCETQKRIPCKLDLNFRVALNAPLSTNSMSIALLPSELV